MRRVTPKLLERMGAVCDELDIFRKEWPRGCAPTEKNILRAFDLGLSVEWALHGIMERRAWMKGRKSVLQASDEYCGDIRQAFFDHTTVTGLSTAGHNTALVNVMTKNTKAIAKILAEILANPKNWRKGI